MELEIHCMQITRREIYFLLYIRAIPPLLNRFFSCLSPAPSHPLPVPPSFLSNRARSRKLAAHAAAKRKLKEGSRLPATPSFPCPLHSVLPCFQRPERGAASSSRNFLDPTTIFASRGCHARDAARDEFVMSSIPPYIILNIKN